MGLWLLFPPFEGGHPLEACLQTAPLVHSVQLFDINGTDFSMLRPVPWPVNELPAFTTLTHWSAVVASPKDSPPSLTLGQQNPETREPRNELRRHSTYRDQPRWYSAVFRGQNRRSDLPRRRDLQRCRRVSTSQALRALRRHRLLRRRGFETRQVLVLARRCQSCVGGASRRHAHTRLHVRLQTTAQSYVSSATVQVTWSLVDTLSEGGPGYWGLHG